MQSNVQIAQTEMNLLDTEATVLPQQLNSNEGRFSNADNHGLQ